MSGAHIRRRLGALLAVTLLACGAGSHAADQTPDLSPVAASPQPSTLAEGWQYGAFMEIFVRAYKDSNGDGIGDLRGLTQQLDYLKELGIKGIWLMPITASSDHDHGYATVDFRAIEPDYGTMADFDELVRQAHARGIGIIIDYVVNHSSAKHPLFARAASDPKDRYRNWFVWQDTAPKGWDIWGKDPWTTTPNGAFFATFGPHMPDFNLRNSETVEYHMSSLRFWLNRGLDGFRLDAVPHLIENSRENWNDQPESRKLTGDIRALIDSYGKRYTVCEATANPQVYAAPDICSSAFSFGLEHQIVEAAQGKTEAIQKVADYFKTAPPGMATFLSNHDIFAGTRLWDQLDGNLAQYRMAAATYLLLPGVPFIYYGEEIGMAGLKGLDGDAPLRAPMSWTADAANGGFTTGKPFRPVSPNVSTQNAAAQAAEPNSLLSFYKTVIKLRNAYPSIARGSYLAAQVDGRLMSFQRKFGNEHTVVAFNYGKRAGRVTLTGLPAGAVLMSAHPVTSESLQVDTKGVIELQVEPQSFKVLVVKP
jgi:glycosidase